MIGWLLPLLATQAGVFEDREAGFDVQVPVGWQLVFAGPEGRAVLKRADEPSVFVRVETTAQADEEITAGRWDGYLERYREVLSARLPGLEIRRHATAPAGAPSTLEFWMGSGEGKSAVEGYVRTLAVEGRLLILSGNAARDRWEARREAIEAVVRSARFRPAVKGAGAVWTDPQRDYAIGVPAGHRIRPESRGALALSLFAPEAGANLTVVVQGAERSFAVLGAKELRAQLEPMLRKQFPDLSYLEFEKTEWNGLAGIRTASEFSHGELKLANFQFGVSTEKRSYYLTWSTRRERLEKERAPFESLLKTFALGAGR
jgi:hypothetical protein